VGVGRALLAARSGLLLDEPFAGLNPQLARTVAEFVVRAAAQISGPTLIATHHHDRLPANLPTMVLTQGHLESGQSVPG
jgi:ABC-type thiamine transport system ATPase subunit